MNIRMNRTDLFAIFFSCLFLLPALAPQSAKAHTLDVNTMKVVSFDHMIRDLADVRLVFVGELHDHIRHHEAQLQIIDSLHKAGIPVAIGLEMYRHKNQSDLDAWVSGQLGEDDFRKDFLQNWGMWEQYEGILKYARDEGIPLVGLNVPREVTRQVATEGFASLPPEKVAELPGVRCNVDKEYEEYIRMTLGVHAHQETTFRNFCEAQMVWDTAMAHYLSEYAQAHPEKTVVVLAGSGHAWKHGVPEQIRRRTDLSYRVVLPEIPGRLAGDNVTRNQADYMLLGIDEGPAH